MTDEIQERFPHLLKPDIQDESAIRGLYHGDITQYLKITKWSLQKYLEGCMREDGQFRAFFERFASFTGDYVVNEQLSEDAEKRHIQIARYFSAMREFPPQIFIQDNGYEYTPASLGGLTAGVNTRDRWGTQIVRVMDVVPVPVQIVVAATDEQQTEDLQSFVTAAFGQYQKFTCGYVLRVPWERTGVYWEVRVPLGHGFGAKSHSPLHGDPRVQLWQATCSMTVEFENSAYIKYRADPRYVQDQTWNMQIRAPDKVRISKPVLFKISEMPYPIRVYSDDSEIALVSRMKTQFKITPKRLGTFKIIVVKGTSEAPHSVLAEKQVSIIAG